DGVVRYCEDNRNRCRHPLCSEEYASRRDDDVDLEPDELRRNLGSAFVAPFRPAILNCHAAALDPAKLAQTQYKCRHPWPPGRSRGPAQKPDGRQLTRLLRARRERPGCRAAEQRDELAAPNHSITWAASESRLSEISMPSALAVLKIDDKLEFGRLFNRQIAGIGALENSVDVTCGAAKQITVAWSITDQAACLGKFTIGIHRRQSISRGQIQDLASLTVDDRIGNNDEGLHRLFLYLFERVLNRSVSGNRHRMKP